MVISFNLSSGTRPLPNHVHLPEQMFSDCHHAQNKTQPSSVHATYLVTGIKSLARPRPRPYEDEMLPRANAVQARLPNQPFPARPRTRRRILLNTASLPSATGFPLPLPPVRMSAHSSPDNRGRPPPRMHHAPPPGNFIIHATHTPHTIRVVVTA
jgi:hypothetical protein